jgi:hypothetical protein
MLYTPLEGLGGMTETDHAHLMRDVPKMRKMMRETMMTVEIVDMARNMSLRLMTGRRSGRTIQRRRGRVMTCRMLAMRRIIKLKLSSAIFLKYNFTVLRDLHTCKNSERCIFCAYSSARLSRIGLHRLVDNFWKAHVSYVWYRNQPNYLLKL